MSPIRQALVRLHRYAGLAMALFLVVAGLTGSIIAFHRELDGWLNPHLFLSSSRESRSLSPAALAGTVERADPRIRVSFIQLGRQAGHAATVFVMPRTDPATGSAFAVDYSQVFVDPATGRILGQRDYGACCFTREKVIPFLYQFHYTLHLPGLWGAWLMGGVALTWLADCFVGFCLTLPRCRPFFARWRPAWAVKWRGSAYRVNFDIHRAGSLWGWALLFILALSGVALNLHDEVFEPVVASITAVTPDVLDQRYETPRAPSHAPALDFDSALSLAQDEAVRRRWTEPPHSIFHSPEAGVYGVNFGDAEEPGLGLKVLYVDDGNGQFVGGHEPGAGTIGDLIHDVQFPLHSGRIAGLPGRVLISVSGLAIAGLAVTGIIIWHRKRAARQPARQRPVVLDR